MVTGKRRRAMRDRISKAAETALTEERVVTVVDVLVRVGWLKESKVTAWRQGRVQHLAQAITAREENVRSALQFLHDWAEAKKLDALDTEYLSQSLEPRPLRFTAPEAPPHLEAAFRARWISSDLTEKQRTRLELKQAKAPEVVVIMPLNDDWTCGRCGGSGPMLVMDQELQGPICLGCAGLSDLEFLAAGDTNLTRKARAQSPRSFVVIRFNKRRKRYERQGTLVDPDALERVRRSLK